MSSVTRLKVHNDALPVAKALRLDEALDYVPGAVVSRTLARSPGGSITLFAFEAGQELSEHTAAYDAFFQVLDGAVELTVGGEKVTARRGETVLMPAGIPHAVRAVERFKGLLTMVKR
jgi:quercetin dioxygenase-like cupin family protein